MAGKVAALAVEKIKPLTTEELAVAGVDVVEQKPAGRPIVGPFYADELEQLREMLRQMPKRDEHVVFESNGTSWIHRK